MAYSLRQLAVTILNLAASLILMRTLLPEDFGYAAIVGVMVGFATILADGGLGVYLVQRRDEITEREVSHITVVQLLLWFVILAVLTLLLVGVWIRDGETTVWLLVWSALWSVPLSIMRSASFNYLDRALNFEAIAVIEVGEQCIYTFVAVCLALSGFGVWSIVTAAIVKPLLGWRLASLYAPWGFVGNFEEKEKETLKRALRFGFWYQMPGLLETLRSAINPAFIGGVLGLSSAGYVDRSIMVASTPNNFLAVIWRKILFPFVSRIQDDRESAKKTFELSVYIYAVIDKCIYLPLFAFCPDLVRIFLGEKWLPIVPLVYVFVSGNIVFAAYSATAMGFFSGLGDPKIMARWSVVQLVCVWVLAVVFVHFFGKIGYAYACLTLWLGVFYMHYHVRRLIGSVTVVGPVLKILTAMGVGLAVTRLLVAYAWTGPLTLLPICGLSLIGILTYFLFLGAIDCSRFRSVLQHIIVNLWRQPSKLLPAT